MDIKERLQDLADGAPTIAVVPASLVPLARRRTARNVAVFAVGVALVVTGTISGIRALDSAGPRHKVIPAKPSRTSAWFEAARGRIVVPGRNAQVSSELIAIDPLG